MELKARPIALFALLATLVLAPAASAQMPGGAPQAPAGALHRYYSPSTDTHWVTPTPVGGDFAYELSLGYLLTHPGPGRTRDLRLPHRRRRLLPLRDAGLRGHDAARHLRLGEDRARARPSVPLYRCVRPGIGHFASNDAGCEGQTSEGRLGYCAPAPRRARPLLQQRPLVTTGGPVSAGYALESVLGFLLRAGRRPPRAVRVPRRAATASSRSTRAARARRSWGSSGYLYADAAGRRGRHAVYRCRIGSRALRLRATRAARARSPRAGSGTCGARRRSSSAPTARPTDTHWVTRGPRSRRAGSTSSRSATCSRARAATGGRFGCLRGHDRPVPLARAGLRGPGRSSAARAGSTPRPRRRGDRAAVPLPAPGRRPLRVLDPGCEGYTTEGLLGYLRTDGPEPPPRRAAAADLRPVGREGDRVRCAGARCGGSASAAASTSPAASATADGSPAAGARP